MTMEEFHNATEQVQIAEMLGMAIEYADEFVWDPMDMAALRHIYKKYCLDHDIMPNNWYLGIY